MIWRKNCYNFRFQSYGSKGFNGFWCDWPWPWHFKVIWFLFVQHIPLHGWCKFWRDMFIISGSTFCKVHSKVPSNMCIHFEKNRLRIDDFRKSEKKSSYVVSQIWGSLREAPFYKSYDPLCDFYRSGDLDLDFVQGWTYKHTDRQTAVTNILCKNLRLCKLNMELVTYYEIWVCGRSWVCDPAGAIVRRGFGKVFSFEIPFIPNSKFGTT